MSNIKSNKVSKIAKYRAMITGVQANVGPSETITIRGTATAQPVIVSTLQGFIDAAANVATALAAYREAVAKQQQAAVAANVTYLDVKAYAVFEYRGKPTVLETFGLEVPARKVPDAATKAAAAAKRKATLAANGTTGHETTATAPAPATGGSGTVTTTRS